jgi:glycine dehydrogenase
MMSQIGTKGRSLPPFAERHVGPNPEDLEAMLEELGFGALDSLTDSAVPAGIRLRDRLDLPPPQTEFQALQTLSGFAAQNTVARSYIGMGYHPTVTPPVLQRNILENPGWYTAYTPYQPEIAQGRLEALLNFQTMITDLTGLEIANASLLDEATAAAEAMHLCQAVSSRPADRRFFVSADCHPQTIAVVQTRARPLGIEIVVGDHRSVDLSSGFFGILVQYPNTNGIAHDFHALVQQAHSHDTLVVVAADPLSLTLLTPPGEFGADVCVGSSQRFGVPVGFGGPHAAFFATRDRFKRHMPGRLVGVSKDASGKNSYRLALQTREQHIRRDKATSNICTAQVLLAVMASMYAVYHGPKGLRAIAATIRAKTERLAAALGALGYQVFEGSRFDTIKVAVGSLHSQLVEQAETGRINLRRYPDGALGISLDETTSEKELEDLLRLFGQGHKAELPEYSILEDLPLGLRRESAFLQHPVFNRYHTETELMRYLKRLENRDLSLTSSMIPLGSCTMKLNAAVEMLPISWPGFSQIHPFAPAKQTAGYRLMIEQLEGWLAEITGFDQVWLAPNAGSQGEYAGLLVIREYHIRRGALDRNICLIPTSAHGTNPASAVMAGFEVVPVLCDAEGNIDLTDLRAKADRYRDRLGVLMVTYPSTHGVFEEAIAEICHVIHSSGGQVYMDGANMNAQVGLCRPADFGADVCHLNLHKTFCIPHGGGGPGVGPIGVKSHLVEFLPTHPLADFGRPNGIGAVTAAPYGSASILCISWAYIALMGSAGLTHATKVAIANANYIAKRLEKSYPVLYRGKSGLVAHECIIDLRQFKRTAGIEVEDVAKRLMDYGFHAPTMSWPVPGTMMIEPTESESKAELDRFCDAMISIFGEIRAIETGEADRSDNVLKRAPHTAQDLLADPWDRSYSRESAGFPAPWTRESKYWPPVARIDNVYGDRNLFCTCAPVESTAATNEPVRE